MVQMPSGYPVGTLAIGKPGAINAALLAASIVALTDPAAAESVMCRNTISVSWDGRGFDCDFTQQLEMDAAVPFAHVADFDLAAWQGRQILTARHCYGCTAGAGSSCGGATP